MKRITFLILAIFLVSCTTPQNKTEPPRTPSSSGDLSGTYLGEAYFNKRFTFNRPAMRLYLNASQDESDTYYGVLMEYDQLMNMGLPYIASQKAPALNKVVGYLDKIATRISAYKFVPGARRGSYEMHTLEVRNGKLVPSEKFTMTLNLNERAGAGNLLAGAEIVGNPEGKIVFPDASVPEKTNPVVTVFEALQITQFDLAKVIYKLGHLQSSWRGNWNDLEGSYLSEYGRFTDGVLELYSDKGQKRMRFVKTNTTKAKYFTNPKSAAIEGDFIVLEPVPKMYVLIPSGGKVSTASHKEMMPRIGLFLDVFDGSAPEAGSHLVTELAFTNPQDPEDFMMYYEHPQHLKNVGVEPKKK